MKLLYVNLKKSDEGNTFQIKDSFVQLYML